MSKNLVVLLPFFHEPKLPALAPLEVILNPRRYGGADSRKAVDHYPDQRPVPKADESIGFSRVKELPGFIGREDRRSPPLDAVLWPFAPSLPDSSGRCR